MPTNDNATVSARLRQRVLTDPDRDFVACGGDWISVGHVRERARSLATGLYESGVRPGDRIASIMTNRPEAFDLFFACAELGAVHVPLNVYLKGEFLRYQLADAAPSTVIADASAMTAVAELTNTPELSAAQLVTLDEPVPNATRFEDLVIAEAQRWPDPDPADLACILYTSGTTGAPKGCMIEAGYLVNMSRAHLLNGWFDSADTSLCPLPLYHGFAISALMDALVCGCRVAFDPVFSASNLIDRARAIGATQIFGVGAMATATLSTPPRPDDTAHTLERAVFIPAAPRVQHEFETRFGCRVLSEGYGQTEVLPATMGPWSPDRQKPSAGRAVPWLDVRVVDKDDRILPTGESGEIVVRPQEPYSMYSGYWRKEKETLSAWRNLWHHTGDLGYFDEDGVLYYVDRRKDAIRRRGENVSSVELEIAVLGHPAIAQVAVHAVPSELSEDEIKACIVLVPETHPEPRELFEYFRAHLPYFAVPRYIEFLDELPVNAVGRILKHKLRETWDTAGTVDFQELGLVIDRRERR